MAVASPVQPCRTESRLSSTVSTSYRTREPSSKAPTPKSSTINTGCIQNTRVYAYFPVPANFRKIARRIPVERSTAILGGANITEYYVSNDCDIKSIYHFICGNNTRFSSTYAERKYGIRPTSFIETRTIFILFDAIFCDSHSGRKPENTDDA
jgi:hypothetical protein